MGIQNSNKQGDVERVSDFGLVAALVSSGAVFRGIERQGRRAIFIFDKTESLQKTVEKYWADELVVPARRHFDTTKMLKNRIYSE